MPKSQRLCRNVVNYGFCKFENRGCEFCHDPALLAQSSSAAPHPRQPPPQPQQFPPLPLPGQTLPPQSRAPAPRPGQPQPPRAPPSAASAAAAAAGAARSTKSARPMAALAMDDAYRSELLRREQALHFMPPQDDIRVRSFPPAVHRYHSVCLLDDVATLFSRPASPAPAPKGKAKGAAAAAAAAAATAASTAAPTADAAQTPARPATQLFAASSSVDGAVVVLRRVPGVAHVGDAGRLMAERWGAFRHASVLPLLDSFISSEVAADPSLFLVYPFKPCAVTLLQHCTAPAPAPARLALVPAAPSSATTDSAVAAASPEREPDVPEALVWSAACQLLSALAAMHAAGLCARSSLSPARVLVLPATGRLYIGSCGVDDITTADAPPQTAPAGSPRSDLVHLGMLLLCLALRDPRCYTAAAPASSADAAEEHVAALEQHGYSRDLCAFVRYLLVGREAGADGGADGGAEGPELPQALALLAPHMLEVVGAQCAWCDTLEGQLQLEMHNGRLFRVLAKLLFVVQQQQSLQRLMVLQQQQQQQAPQLSQQGQPQPPMMRSRGDVKMNEDSMLRYFFAYLFHNDGACSDLANVVDSLNKLDAGSGEEIALPSDDQQQVYIVQYADLKRILANRYAALSAKLPAASPARVV